MCHCFEAVDDLSETERTEMLESHTEAELRAELSDDDLTKLGIAA